MEAPLSAFLEQSVPHLSEIISRSQLVRLTVVYSPARLARLFVELEGQFYDRDEFEDLAGRLFELLLDTSPPGPGRSAIDSISGCTTATRRRCAGSAGGAATGGRGDRPGSPGTPAGWRSGGRARPCSPRATTPY